MQLNPHLYLMFGYTNKFTTIRRCADIRKIRYWPDFSMEKEIKDNENIFVFLIKMFSHQNFQSWTWPMFSSYAQTSLTPGKLY